jgi:hypothetical protein
VHDSGNGLRYDVQRLPNLLHANRATSGDIDLRQKVPDSRGIVLRHSLELN